jgi:hypothetical protein
MNNNEKNQHDNNNYCKDYLDECLGAILIELLIKRGIAN